MKKQFVAKLVALALVLGMLPTAAFAAKLVSSEKAPVNGVYNQTYWYDGAYYIWEEDTYTYEEVVFEEPTEAEPEEITELTVGEDGKVVVELTVVDGVANGKITAAAIESLAAQLPEGAETLVLSVKADNATKVILTLPGTAVAKLAADTGVSLTVENPVANFSIANETLVAIEAEALETVAEAGTATATADGEEVAVEVE